MGLGTSFHPIESKDREPLIEITLTPLPKLPGLYYAANPEIEKLRLAQDKCIEAVIEKISEYTNGFQDLNKMPQIIIPLDGAMIMAVKLVRKLLNNVISDKRHELLHTLEQNIHFIKINTKKGNTGVIQCRSDVTTQELDYSKCTLFLDELRDTNNQLEIFLEWFEKEEIKVDIEFFAPIGKKHTLFKIFSKTRLRKEYSSHTYATVKDIDNIAPWLLAGGGWDSGNDLENLDKRLLQLLYVLERAYPGILAQLTPLNVSPEYLEELIRPQLNNLNYLTSNMLFSSDEMAAMCVLLLKTTSELEYPQILEDMNIFFWDLMQVETQDELEHSSIFNLIVSQLRIYIIDAILLLKARINLPAEP